jgi:hypothetical protein
MLEPIGFGERLPYKLARRIENAREHEFARRWLPAAGGRGTACRCVCGHLFVSLAMIDDLELFWAAER